MFKVALHKVEAGEIRLAEDDREWEYQAQYWWIEGNGSCDCNRELAFGRAIGENPGLDEVWCSEDRFVLEYFEMVDGTRIAPYEP